ncbi:uncharacterized protein LOC109421489 [Aedes albopictus]|uniref:Secreted protein n=1 Tax=Aedes albopictus TaxID=7160 RepID=A0ABM1Z6Z9_AEDAL
MIAYYSSCIKNLPHHRNISTPVPYFVFRRQLPIAQKSPPAHCHVDYSLQSSSVERAGQILVQEPEQTSSPVTGALFVPHRLRLRNLQEAKQASTSELALVQTARRFEHLGTQSLSHRSPATIASTQIQWRGHGRAPAGIGRASEDKLFW